jgi:hypothetical protein
MRCSMLHVPGATRAAKRVGCSIVTTERGRLAHSERSWRPPGSRRRRGCTDSWAVFASPELFTEREAWLWAPQAGRLLARHHRTRAAGPLRRTTGSPAPSLRVAWGLQRKA